MRDTARGSNFSEEGSVMDPKRLYKMTRGYSFLARNMIGGKIFNVVLDLLAFMDYRMLIFLSMWHPDNDTRIKLLRKRGVNVGEHVFIDQGVWIEITTPQAVVIEDYVGVQHGAVIVAHDSTVGRIVDAPLRVKETRLRYGSGLGMNCIVMPGVEFGEYAHAMAGAVVTKDIPTGMVVAGNPAEIKCKVDDIGLAWQADISAHPEIYYDYPNPWRPPSSPFDHLVTWRSDGVQVRPATDIRTGTPFDYIIEAKVEKEQRNK
jgi:acetyltransferase-like isoleucine patch superfamily enzyme